MQVSRRALNMLPRDSFHIGVAGPCSPQAFAVDLQVSPCVLPQGLGGTPVNHLVRALLDLGLRVTVATLDRSVQLGDELRYSGPLLSLAIGPYRGRHRARDRFKVERQAIRNLMVEASPTAITAHWSYEFALGAIESEIPTMVTVRDVPREILRHQPSAYRLVRWLMHRETMTRATSIAYNSEYTRNQVRHPRSQGALILPNALPEAMWKLGSRDPPSSSSPVFVSVNNGFGRLKNLRSLLRAFADLRKQVRGARLSLIGKGSEPDGPAAAWARKSKCAEGVEYLGTLSYGDTLDAIRASDVLVHPSLEESFGYTLIEAASVGTPVIAGKDSGAVPWVLDYGAQGLLVDVRSPTAIAEAMLSLVSDVATWSELRKRAFQRGRARFSATAVAKRYVDALREIADARSTRTR